MTDPSRTASRLRVAVLLTALTASSPTAPAGEPPGFGQGAVGGYYSFDEVVALLDGYAAQHPHIVSPKILIGTSVEGRPIYAVKVSDHPQQSEPEPRVLIDALHHAREPTSMQTALLALHRLVEGYGVDSVVTQLVDEREVWFVPVVNPDGYVHNQLTHPNGGGPWRKNRAVHGGACVGVDLNRNYAFQWGVDDLGSSGDPCAESYRGPVAMSEPETVAMDGFAAQQGFSMVVSLHAHGRKMIHPHGYAPLPSPHDAEYAVHGARMSAVNGYPFGPVHAVLGLANGNAIDHHEAVFGSRAWTFELGGEFWPPVDEMIAIAERNVEPLLSLVGYAGAWVEVVSVGTVETLGDGDGHVEPGEQAALLVELRNLGVEPTQTSVSLHVASSSATIDVPSESAGPMASLQATTTQATGLRFSVPAAANAGTPLSLELTVQFDAVSITRTHPVDVGVPRLIAWDDAESDVGWSLGDPTDDAATGRWQWDDPKLVVHGAEVAQPEHDASPGPGTRCYVTGNGPSAPGQDDVDWGTTTLTSPPLDLSAAVGPVLRYRRFYWCSNVDDPLRVEISSDAGQTWHTLEVVLGQENEWVERTWRIADVVAPTADVRVRFVASDPTNNSVTEALVDELTVTDFGVDPHLALIGVPRVGEPLELQVAAPSPGVAWLFLSAGTSAVKVGGAHGMLLLDPTTLAWLGAWPVQSGLTRWPVTVPDQPALAGITVHVQALTHAPVPTWSNAAAVDVQP